MNEERWKFGTVVRIIYPTTFPPKEAEEIIKARVMVIHDNLGGLPGFAGVSLVTTKYQTFGEVRDDWLKDRWTAVDE